MFERLRRLAERRRTGERAEYECTQCGTAYTVRRQVCPECGGYRVERTDWRDWPS